MNELIKVNYSEERPTVSARELHNFLEATERFSNWFERMKQYLMVDEDFTGCKVFNALARQELQDYQLTVEAAKEIAMLQRNEKGKQARRYFIQLEKDWNSPEKVMARALQIADKKIRSLTIKVEQDKPKVLFADAVAASNAPMLIGELAKVLKQNGVDTGERRLFSWLRDNGFLIRRNGTHVNAPTQKSMEMQLFSVKESAIAHADGHVTINRTTKVTGKGQQYFINKFLGSNQLN